MRMVDVWGLAGGGVILGGEQAGFKIAARKSHGFGDNSVEANRHLLGSDWECQTTKADGWLPEERIAYSASVPPCSGFSLLNTAASTIKKRGKKSSGNERGPSSAINSCQAEAIEYAASCTGSDGQQGPEIITFESVRGAFSQGLPLMREYWQALREVTGQPYELTHLLHDLATLGGPQIRPRYFWVAHRVPFGVDLQIPKRITTLRDAIGDLENLEVKPGPQALTLPPSAYSARLRRDDGVVDAMVTMLNRRHQEVIEQFCSIGWNPGENHVAIIKKALAEKPDLPAIKQWWREDALDPRGGRPRGFMGPRRLKWDRPSYVVTGGGPWDFVHPSQDRLLTMREIGRLMGVPDAWRLDYAKRPETAGAHLGKNCSTLSGKWVADWAMASIKGNPGSVTERADKYKKLERMPGEHIIDFIPDYRAVLKAQLGEEALAEMDA
jgi:site-specific DNA-cytosine methylase